MITYQRYIMGILLLLGNFMHANNASYLHQAQQPKNVFFNFKPIETDRLIIRQFELADCDSLCNMMTDPQVINQTIALQLHTDRQQTVQLVDAIMHMYTQDFTDSIIFAIADKETNTLMGYCGFYAYAPLFNRAEIGYALCSAHWGKGIVPEACRALVAYGFEQCGLNRIEATVYPENAGSIRVCQKLGMKQEGVLRQHVKREGRYRDRLLFALLKEEWQQVNKAELK